MKRWFFLTVVALLAFGTNARADEASKRAKVEELVVVMHMDKLGAQILATIQGQLKSTALAGEGVSPAQKKIEQDFEDQSLKLIADTMSWENMKSDYVNLYMKTFTEEEISGMVAFYRSPVGQAVLAKLPQISASSMEMAKERMATIQPRLDELQDHYREQMDALSAEKQKSSAPAPKN